MSDFLNSLIPVPKSLSNATSDEPEQPTTSSNFKEDEFPKKGSSKKS